MKVSIFILTTTFFATLLSNKSPFYMNVSMVLMSASLSLWALWVLNKWMFSVLIIFYLGGMMVLFGYIVSLSKSKHTFLTYPYHLWALVSGLAVFSFEMTPQDMHLFFKAYYTVNGQLTFFLACVLLLLLITTNKICLSYFGPMVYKKNE